MNYMSIKIFSTQLFILNLFYSKITLFFRNAIQLAEHLRPPTGGIAFSEQLEQGNVVNVRVEVRDEQVELGVAENKKKQWNYFLRKLSNYLDIYFFRYLKK